MRISEMLNAIASWLESPNNEAILLAEYDDECLKVVAESCVQAAALLKITAETVEDIEPPEESKLTPESLDGLVQIATAFDASGDPELKKQASVIDELLLTIASPPNALSSIKEAEDKKIDELQRKYKKPSEELERLNKVSDSLKAIEKSQMTKDMRPLEGSLSTRTCPDHHGCQMARIGEDEFQCNIDKKIYDFKNGFTLNDGTKIPGGDVSLQTTTLDIPYFTLFDTRDDRMNS
jgi:hypothetical protein